MFVGRRRPGQLPPGSPGEALVGTLRDERLAHPKAPCNRYLVQWLLPGGAHVIARRAAHHERSRGNPDVFEPILGVLTHFTRVWAKALQPGFDTGFLPRPHRDALLEFSLALRRDAQLVRTRGYVLDHKLPGRVRHPSA